MRWNYPGSETDEDPYVVNWITSDSQNLIVENESHNARGCWDTSGSLCVFGLLW